MVRFDGFEFDPAACELVTREAIQARLWPHGTVVEFEHSVRLLERANWPGQRLKLWE